MPRNKTDKFILKPVKSGPYKGMKFLTVNYMYDGRLDNITLADLMKFLKEKKVPPSDVKMPATFMVYV